MAETMSAAHQNFITQAAGEARLILGLTEMLNQLNILWAGAPNYDELITQAMIDSVPAFAGAGLTVQDIADALFAYAGLLNGINQAMVSLTILASVP